MWLNETVLEPVRRHYGEPRVLELELEVSCDEWGLVVASGSSRRRHHDVTLFVFNDERIALIQKPHYTEGLWRPPGGGLHEGEPFEEGVLREAREELGVPVELRRYLVRTRAVFTFGGERIPWATHVFEATTSAQELLPEDEEEISAARWGTLPELSGPIRERLLATERALWHYRVLLHDAATEALHQS